MTYVKFCGMREQRDVDVACELGVQAMGFVLWPRSPRFVDLARVAAIVRSLPDSVTPVGVFVRPTEDEIDAARDAGIRVAQLHGVDTVQAAPPAALERWLATSVDADLSAYGEGTVLLDAADPERHGGTGRTIDWQKAAAMAQTRRVLLAGGLTTANVADAIRVVRPFGVDVASGIEQRPGVKDAHAMRTFVAAVRKADQWKN